MKPASIRVSVVEDDNEFRGHLAALLRGSGLFECAGTHARAETMLRQIAFEKPNVILLDLELPGKSGLELLTELNVDHPDVQSLILTIHDDPQRIFPALEAGASGYLVKPVPPVRILEAIGEVHHGGAPMTSQIARLVVNSFRPRGKARRQLATLTGREEEILDLLAKGYLSKEISSSLAISVRTLETHLHHIYEKLHVRSRAQAVAKYYAG